MSFYQQLAAIGSRFVSKHILFKHGFNWSPMYRRSSAKIIDISKDFLQIRIKLAYSYTNKNFVGSIFGGSMFAAVDPIPMTQLMQILGDDYVVWDKSAEIYFKRPAREVLFADFHFRTDELEAIRKKVSAEKEIVIRKTTHLTNKDKNTVFCEIRKTIYIADKTFYKQKRKLKKQPV